MIKYQLGCYNIYLIDNAIKTQERTINGIIGVFGNEGILHYKCLGFYWKYFKYIWKTKELLVQNRNFYQVNNGNCHYYILRDKETLSL